MIRFIGVLLTVGVLAGCGADGPPERPSSGVKVTGDARIGVVLN
ncbi:MAG: hypothetical protein U0934_21445 [Pseudotabrizicola sp.]|nr:hypothetical protein [Pseudotabrizicola sp.]MDO8882516.1 hypothetical protein [Pseudotabrizicola sp.]MDP2082093.1 hypothetical protein [Pseudotabrizicola sp.]MDZ7576486.1 hypothetical protein [Pseudotabrizicola sp.]